MPKKRPPAQKSPASTNQAAGTELRSKSETKLGTRASAYRIRRIHEILKKDRRPTAQALADALEVSVRCIKQDISDMRTYHHLPIEVEGRHGGYFYPRNEVADLPSTVTLTRKELMAFLVALQAMEPVRGSRFARHARSGMRKILAELNGAVDIDLDAMGSEISFGAGNAIMLPDLWESLVDAAQSREEIEFHYLKLTDKTKTPEPRRVRPMTVVWLQGGWYLLGYDLDRDGEGRQYFLPRISKVRRTNVSFERPKDFSIKTFLKNSIGAFGGAAVRVKLRFRGIAARLVSERLWHGSQTIRSLDDGESIELCLEVASTPELRSWILSWGAEVEVLEPAELRQSVRQAVLEMWKLNS